MVCDISAIANHKLVTTGIAALAADIAARMNARVVYGTEHDLADFVPAGEAGEGTRTLRLCDLREKGDGPEVVAYELFDVPGTGTYNIWIYKDCFLSDAAYGPGRFGMFCKRFTGIYPDWEDVLQYRRDVHTEATLLGGDTAIYFGDQCGASFVGYDADSMPFAAILTKVLALRGKALNIDDWLHSFSGTYEYREPDAFIDRFGCWGEPGVK
jgi:hypothetical protein